MWDKKMQQKISEELNLTKYQIQKWAAYQRQKLKKVSKQQDN